MDAGGPRSLLDRGYLAGLAGVLTLEAVGVAAQLIWGTPAPSVTVVAAALVVACMLRVHGLWGTMAFAVLTFAIPFGSEFLGVLTGYPYGTYAYSNAVGPRLFGLVPIFIFIAWIHISYLAIATTTLGLGRSRLWLAPLDGMIAAGWDLMVDPLAVRAGFWTWQAPGGFYGVPVSNFLGWFLVVTILSLASRAVWARDSRLPPRTSRTVAAILPALLLGTSVAFGLLAMSNGMVYAAIVGNVIIVPAVVLAWRRILRAPARRIGPNPWSAGARAPTKDMEAERA